MLKRVSIANVATFSGDTQVFGDLRKVNFVYGSNGCGKTTISRIIDHPEQYAACTVTWEGNLRLPAFVYNRDFVRENFKQADSIKGIFTLGSNDNVIHERIEERQNKISQCEEAIKKMTLNLEGENGLGGKRKELKDKEEAIVTYCWDNIKRAYDVVFKKAFEGLRGNRAIFAEFLLKRLTSSALPCRDENDLIADAESVFKDNVSPHDAYKTPDFNLLRSSLQSAVFAQIIVGGKDIDIAGLITQLQNSDWVRQGQQMLAQSNGLCPFCQQALPKDFAEKINTYFDATYISNIAKLDKVVEECKYLLNTLTGDINAILSSPDDGFIDFEALRNVKLSLDTKISLIRKCLDEKIKEPSRSIVMPTVEEESETIYSIINHANDKVAKHNSLVNNLSVTRGKLIDDIWRFLIEKNRSRLLELIAEKDSLKKAVDGLENSIKEQKKFKSTFSSEIVTLQKQLTSVQPTIVSINGLLDSYGFTSFRLAPAGETSYKLQRRDGTDVGDTLSEGEKSFVTFLYFYHLLRGGANPATLSENRIAVIDDPVSSLDSNILFVVSSLIHECINNIYKGEGRLKQLIVLTHNVYFFKEITFISKFDSKLESDRTYWVVRKDENVSTIRNESTNPIKTSYELLWREIQIPTISKIAIQNAMRRIIEYYFKLLGGISQEELLTSFTGKDRIVFKSLFSWMNDGSHSIDDDLHYQVVDAEIETFKDVFQRIFVASNHAAHYEMMMQNACETPACTTEAGNDTKVGTTNDRDFS